jgi:Tfp pilus assembly protein PilN
MRIEINLLGGQKKRKKAAGAGLKMPNIQELMGQVKDPLLLGAIGAWVIALGFVGFFFLTTRTALANAQAEANRVQEEAARYRDLLVEKRRAVQLRDSLAAELRAIRRIDSDRYVWPHILEEVTKALPDYTWLTSLQAQGGAPMVPGAAPAAPAAMEADTGAAPPVRFRIEGRTSEIAAYTRFLRQLAASPWIALVEDGPASRVEEDGRALTQFSIVVTFRSADSAFILTVPVTESVR